MQPNPRFDNRPVMTIGSAMHNIGMLGMIKAQIRGCAQGAAVFVDTHFVDNMGDYTGSEGRQAQAAAAVESMKKAAVDAVKEAAVESVRKYLQTNQPDIMVLEWNLAHGGQPEPTFDPEFFSEWHQIKFILMTNTVISPAQLAKYTRNSNVEGRLISLEGTGTQGTVTQIAGEVFGEVLENVTKRQVSPAAGDGGEHGERESRSSSLLDSSLLDGANDARREAERGLGNDRAGVNNTDHGRGGGGNEGHESGFEEGGGFEVGGEGRR